MIQASRVLLIELPGVSGDLLRPLGEAGVMPNVAALLRGAAVGRLRSDDPASTAAAA